MERVQTRAGPPPFAGAGARLEGEVEALERLGRREAGGLERDGDTAALARGMPLGEQAVDGLQRGELAALDPPHRVIKGLEGSGHAQADQAGADPVEGLAHPALAFAAAGVSGQERTLDVPGSAGVLAWC
jgi:hypothetical protein